MACDTPVDVIDGAVIVTSAALLGADTLGLQPKLAVTVGDKVKAGRVLFTDRRHPEITYVAPIAGTVSKVALGPRRTLSACIIDADQGGNVPFPVAPLDAETPASVRQHLLERGMWPALRTRPFGRTPQPTAQPAAIFVNAVHANALMADPRLVLDGQMDAFRLGVTILTQLTDGPVHICQSPGKALAHDLPGVRVTSFSGTLAAGLAGTHIDRLHPVASGQEVWSINYQDTAAIGHLFQTGQYPSARVVCVHDPSENRPRLVRTCLGANIADFSAGQHGLGRESRYLGRFQQHVMPDATVATSPRSWVADLLGKTGPVIPTRSVEHALAVDVLSVPLMRALSVGDGAAAERLGCLALIEEDIAVLSQRCTSGADYGVLLRQVLDELMEDAA